MLTTIEAEIDVNGSVTFLEPLKISKKSRAIITLLDDEKNKHYEVRQTNSPIADDENIKSVDSKEMLSRQLEWLKANRERYGGQYVVLDGDKLLGTAPNLREGRQIAVEADVPKAFVTYLSKPDEIGYIGGWE